MKPLVALAALLALNKKREEQETQDAPIKLDTKDGWIVWKWKQGAWRKLAPVPVSGRDGRDGAPGGSGRSGDIGPPGPQGEQGEKGDKGDKGDQGERGERGETGATGQQGVKGDKGDKGDPGPKGDTGPQGLKGDKGDKGDTGAQGQKGDQGQPGINGINGLDGLANLYTSSGMVSTTAKIWCGMVTPNSNGVWTVDYSSAGFTSPPFVVASGSAMGAAAENANYASVRRDTITATGCQGKCNNAVTVGLLLAYVNANGTAPVQVIAIGT